MRANAEIRKGVMSYSTLQKCWKAYTYAERIQLLELLKLFELGFAVDDSHLLLPCLLEHHPPADMPVPAAAALHLCKRFLFTCLPPDLFPRLISRTHRFTLSGVGGTLHSCWATGCWLQKAGHLGRISLDMHNPRKVYIDIDVWGREPFNFYSILCECLEALLWEPSYEGLQTSRQIGCPKCAAGAVFFTEESLEKRIDQGRFRFECITCDSQLDARELLGRALFRPDATPVLFCKGSCMSIGDLSLSRGGSQASSDVESKLNALLQGQKVIQQAQEDQMDATSKLQSEHFERLQRHLLTLVRISITVEHRYAP